MKKTRIYLSEAEWRFIIHSINAFRSKLLSKGQHTDIVDETLYKAMTAKTNRVTTA